MNVVWSGLRLCRDNIAWFNNMLITGALSSQSYNIAHLRDRPPSNISATKLVEFVVLNMSGFNFNFNKAREPKKKGAPPPSKAAFDDDVDEDNVFANSKPSTASKKKQPDAIIGVNQDLRSYTTLSEETSARMAKEALEMDPSGNRPTLNVLTSSAVFAYDEVYDDLKAGEREKKAIAEQERLERKVCFLRR